MTGIPAIDLNCDVGEGAGNDERLMPLVTSANIACGAHAGDVETMRTTVRLARRHGVVIGAHPGYADRAFFGRREIRLPAAEITRLVRGQIEALMGICAEESVAVHYVKPHGALYNQAARDEEVAAAVAEGVVSADSRLGVVGLAGGRLLEAGRARGLRVASEVFADRTYQSDGSLTSRSRPDAVWGGEREAVDQVLHMIRTGRVKALDGTEIGIVADTVCLHGDGAEAVRFARAVRDALIGEGVRLAAGFV
jgi:5-oxoprolinase (ATP-hydrolysing) subunit A